LQRNSSVPSRLLDQQKHGREGGDSEYSTTGGQKRVEGWGTGGSAEKPANSPVTVEVVDGVNMPTLAGAIGSLTARLLWGDEVRGETETMWMGPKPTWFAGNKILCRQEGDQGDSCLKVELVKKEGRAKRSSTQQHVPQKQLIATLELPWKAVLAGKLSGKKTYFEVSPSEEYRPFALPGCKLGLKFT